MENQNLLPATGNVPKVIDASTHAVIDYATAASFFGLGAYLHREHPVRPHSRTPMARRCSGWRC